MRKSLTKLLFYTVTVIFSGIIAEAADMSKTPTGEVSGSAQSIKKTSNLSASAAPFFPKTQQQPSTLTQEPQDNAEMSTSTIATDTTMPYFDPQQSYGLYPTTMYANMFGSFPFFFGTQSYPFDPSNQSQQYYCENCYGTRSLSASDLGQIAPAMPKRKGVFVYKPIKQKSAKTVQTSSSVTDGRTDQKSDLLQK